MVQKILVVDDDADIRECFAYNLEKAGYQVVMADSGLTGLWQLEKEKPDLVLLDLMMPSPDGYELCRYFKQDDGGPRPPVVIVSAKGGRQEIEEGFKLGARDYLPKPVSMATLVSTVKKILGDFFNTDCYSHFLNR